LVALVEPVSTEEFSPEALEQRLQSVEWVAHLARKHEAVLEAAMDHGPVIPARLCTMFSDVDAVKRSLAENEERFLSALARLAGRREWGLKVFCDARRSQATVAAADREVQVLDAALATAAPGHAYVLTRQRDARAAEVAAARIDEVVDEILDILGSLPVEARLKPPPPPQATGRCEPMVLNLAALVGTPAEAAFQAAIDELASRFGQEGFEFEVTGPWPPYSFSDGGEVFEGNESAQGDDGGIDVAGRAR
jgi:hypothetical protein